MQKPPAVILAIQHSSCGNGKALNKVVIAQVLPSLHHTKAHISGSATRQKQLMDAQILLPFLRLTSHSSKVWILPSSHHFTQSFFTGALNSPMAVCIKRSPTQFASVASYQQGTCASGMKTCGNPTKPETVICVDSSESCPVYDFAVSSTIDLVTYPASDWTQVNLQNG